MPYHLGEIRVGIEPFVFVQPINEITAVLPNSEVEAWETFTSCVETKAAPICLTWDPSLMVK
jgi:hypothetical protein